MDSRVAGRDAALGLCDHRSGSRGWACPPPRPDLLVTPTAAGQKVRSVWLPLAGAIEERWRTRFGDDAVDRLRTALLAVVGQVDAELPRYLPVVVHGLRTLAPHLESVSAQAPDGAAASALDLSALLAQALLLFAVDVERESVLSLAISANAMRVIDDDGIRVRDLPTLAGVSKEAIGVSLSFLERNGCIVVEADPNASRTKVARLTQKGRAARGSIGPLLAVVEARWQARFGTDEIEQLHAGLGALLNDPLSGRRIGAAAQRLAREQALRRSNGRACR